MSTDDPRQILITGGAGFIGSNLADRLAGEGHGVLIYDALARPGAERNLAWLRERHGDRINPVQADVRDAALLGEAVRRAKAVFHLAAQVAVTTSLDDPRADFDINVGGTFNLLEAARGCDEPPPIVFASTNKVYGDLGDIALALSPHGYAPRDPAIRAHGVGEEQPLDFHTPYGCSKGAADQYMLDYARSYGLPATVLRMSCIYGQRQLGTEDQGWVAHFLIRAIDGEPITLYGDGQQVRDILEIENAIDAYVAAWRWMDRVRGRAFNLGGGPGNAVSLLTLLGEIGEITGQPVELRHAEWREGDQRYFVADARTARHALELGTPTPWRTGVARLARWLAEERGISLPEYEGQIVPMPLRAVPA